MAWYPVDCPGLDTDCLETSIQRRAAEELAEGAPPQEQGQSCRGGLGSALGAPSHRGGRRLSAITVEPCPAERSSADRGTPSSGRSDISLFDTRRASVSTSSFSGYEV
eukprot:857424-Pyramimonas_sp.AAC.1